MFDMVNLRLQCTFGGAAIMPAAVVESVDTVHRSAYRKPRPSFGLLAAYVGRYYRC